MKYFYSLIWLGLMLFSLSSAQAGLLQPNVVQDMNNNTKVVQEKAGYDANATIGSVVGTIIKGFLALLGIIFVILILIAGYNWMTASGDEEKITKAKDTIRSAVIGLIIIVAAYSITYFIFESLPDGTGNHGGS